MRALTLALLLTLLATTSAAGADLLDPPPTATPVPGITLVGHSVDGNPIVAQQLGDGPMPILLVGGIHGGWEVNTVLLMNEVAAYFAAHPEDIAPNVSLYVIPAANPDGLRHGRKAEGRFNANGVDLNRNWGCNWSAEAFWRSRRVDAGAEPFSEPETQALRDFITALQPVAVLWYHSAAAGVFAGRCTNEDHGSAGLADVVGRAAGYTTGQPFSAYPVSGTAADWVDGLGIPSMDVELESAQAVEWERNHAGIMALQCHFARLGAGDALEAFIARACREGEQDG
ncbi:MAG: hypothetical protein Kow00120_09150 [Anaerolineae bacterium]